MPQVPEARAVKANGISLYYERQGTGPAVLFIAGSTGDAGNFSRAAALLSDEFTAVTYDRRGNSRSPRPAGWTTTFGQLFVRLDKASLTEALGIEGGHLVSLDMSPSQFAAAPTWRDTDAPPLPDDAIVRVALSRS